MMTVLRLLVSAITFMVITGYISLFLLFVFLLTRIMAFLTLQSEKTPHDGAEVSLSSSLIMMLMTGRTKSWDTQHVFDARSGRLRLVATQICTREAEYRIHTPTTRIPTGISTRITNRYQLSGLHSSCHVCTESIIGNHRPTTAQPSKDKAAARAASAARKSLRACMCG